VLRQFVRALRYVRGQLGILVSVLIGPVGNPIFQFTVVFAAEVFVVGPIGLSFLTMALGVGALHPCSQPSPCRCSRR
jgi:hypothetical protein